MRKTIIFLECLIIILTVTSCNSKEPVIEKEEQQEEINNEVLIDTNTNILDSLEYSLGNNLPTLSFDTRVIEYEITDEDKKNELVAAYNIISNYLAINIFRYKKNGHTIQEAIDAQIETYYPGQGLVGHVFDTWKEDYKCNYGYYMAYDTQTYGSPYYVQTFIFVDGDEFVEVDYWYETLKVKTFNGEHFDIPRFLLTEANIKNPLDGEILRYECEPMNGVPNVSFYKRDNVGNDFDKIIEEYQNKYKEVKSEKYRSLLNGNEQQNLYLEYSCEEDANTKYYEYMTIIDNVLFSVCFDVDINNGLFDTVGIMPILLSTNLK